jgi:hAT family C-terminal dimerisation region
MCLRIEKMLKLALNPHDDDESGAHALQSSVARTSRRYEMKQELNEICIHCKDYLDIKRLLRQLDVLRDSWRDKHVNTVRDICSCFMTFGSLYDEVFSEVSRLIRLFLVIPATSATAERSFSAMRRLKTYLRSTMATERLNSVMVLHVHKVMLDQLDDN